MGNWRIPRYFKVSEVLRFKILIFPTISLLVPQGEGSVRSNVCGVVSNIRSHNPMTRRDLEYEYKQISRYYEYTTTYSKEKENSQRVCYYSQIHLPVEAYWFADA
jgi:hypothetical protein